MPTAQEAADWGQQALALLSGTRQAHWAYGMLLLGCPKWS